MGPSWLSELISPTERGVLVVPMSRTPSARRLRRDDSGASDRSVLVPPQSGQVVMSVPTGCHVYADWLPCLRERRNEGLALMLLKHYRDALATPLTPAHECDGVTTTRAEGTEGNRDFDARGHLPVRVHSDGKDSVVFAWPASDVHVVDVDVVEAALRAPQDAVVVRAWLERNQVLGH